MKKRILSLFLVVLLLLGNCICIFAETGETTDEFEFLSVVGFGLDLSDLDKVLTRRELAEVAISLKNVAYVEEGQAVCYDIPVKHKAFPLVNTVLYYSLMEPMSDGMFMLDSPASVSDGARVMLSLLGYDQIGKAMNWSTANYQSKARSLGLMKRVSTQGEGLTVRDLANMALNLLETPVVSIAGIGETISFTSDGDKTYIQQNYGYTVVEGVVQAVGKQAITGSTPVGKANIKIDGKTYNAGGKNYIEYLGMQVKAIVEEDYDTVLAISVESHAEALTVLSDNIISYSNFVFTYFDENEKTTTVKVPRNCEIIVNGQVQTEYHEKDLLPLAGSVTFHDRDGNGDYDIINVVSEVYFKLGSFYEDDGMFDAITSQDISLKDKKLQCIKGGSSVDATAITNGNMVAVRPGAFDYSSGFPMVDESKMSTLTLEVMEKTVRGTVSGVENGNGMRFLIEGTYYEASPYFSALIEQGYLKAPDVFDIAEFYLNQNDEIIYVSQSNRFSATNEAIKYGYLMGIKVDGGLNSNVAMKIVNTQAKEEVIDFAEKFYINDSSKAATVTELLQNDSLYPGGVFKHQLIRYQLDGEGKLKNIHIAKDYANETITDYAGNILPNPNYNADDYEGYDNNAFSLNYAKANHTWNMNINHQYTLSSDTIVFVVPSSPEKLNLWTVADAQSILKNEQSYPIMAYDADEQLEYGAIVIDYAGSGGSASKNMIQTIYNRKIGSCMVTKNITKVIDGETVQCVAGKTYGLVYMQFQGWQDVELIPSYEEQADMDGWGTSYTGTKLSDLKPGDIVEYELNMEGKVDRFRVLAKYADLYDSEGNLQYGTINDKGAMDRMHIARGRVTKLFDNGNFCFSTNAEGTFAGMRLANQNSALMGRGMIRVFIFDKARGTVTQTGTGDLRIGDEGFLRSELGQALDIFVYR